MILSPEVAKIITDKITELDDQKSTCLWNNLISCRCFLDALKDTEESILDDLAPITNEEKALTADTMLSDSDKRQMIISCMESSDPIIKTVGTETAECAATSEKSIDATFNALVSSMTDILDADAKNTLDTMLSGSETIPEKLKMLMNSEFVTNPDAVKAMKEALIDHVGDAEV